jgi:hypothetical protein
MGMKIVDGKFGKKGEEEQSLVDKLAYATGEMVESYEEKGSFVLITKNDEGTAQIATDMSLAEVFLILDVIKYSMLANPEQTTIH